MAICRVHDACTAHARTTEDARADADHTPLPQSFFPISGSVQQVVGQVSLSLPVMFILTHCNHLTSTTNWLYSLLPAHKLTAFSLNVIKN
jgi:hypothetical protein